MSSCPDLISVSLFLTHLLACSQERSRFFHFTYIYFSVEIHRTLQDKGLGARSLAA